MPSNLAAEARGWLERFPAGTVLTARQAEIVRLLADGVTVEEVAAALGIGVRTVDVHLQRARVGIRAAEARRAHPKRRP